MMNENAISNILIDVDFLEEELRRIGRGHLSSVFVELRTVKSKFPVGFPDTLVTVCTDDVDTSDQHCPRVSCASNILCRGET
jgi:hypothetical protein